ncbi:MAG: hypothetical protein AB1592_19295 [Pseudomonadota bacterium]
MPETALTAYIAAIARELATLARQSQLPVLAYLLALAAEEAESSGR